jgi:hypothetical protein
VQDRLTIDLHQELRIGCHNQDTYQDADNTGGVSPISVIGHSVTSRPPYASAIGGGGTPATA